MKALWMLALIGGTILPISAQETRFEVLVLGTYHAPFQFRSARFSPAHVRAALELAKPDVIGVESNPTWFAAGTFHQVTYEAQGVAVPFARDRGIPVYGIDHMRIDAYERRTGAARRQRVENLQKMAAAGPLHPFFFGRVHAKVYERTKKSFADPNNDFEVINGVRDDAYGKRFLRGDVNNPKFGGERNRKIVAHCVDAMKEHLGKRLVIVIGAGHKAVLDRLFARIDGVAVLAWGRDVPPPTPAQVEAAWNADFLLATLGHNLDGERYYLHPEFVDAERMTRLVRKLAQIDGQQAAARYFEARLAFIRGETKRAAALYDDLQKAGLQDAALQNAGQCTLYPFPMNHWRMRYTFAQSLRLERARCALAEGDDAAARQHLDAIDRAALAPDPPKIVKRDPVDILPPIKQPLARSPLAGWYCHDATTGQLEAEVGNAALRLTVVEPRKNGAFGLSHKIALPEALRGKELELTVDMRGEHISRATLVASVQVAKKRLRTLARKPIVPTPRSASHRLRIRTAPEHKSLFFFLHFNGPKGARVWFRQVRLTVGDPPPPIPVDWIPRFLASQYPRTLLAEATK